jgi:hypothetical protein
MKIGAGYRPYFHGIVVRAGRAGVLVVSPVIGP